LERFDDRTSSLPQASADRFSPGDGGSDCIGIQRKTSIKSLEVRPIFFL
jgi:hypothetical protein